MPPFTTCAPLPPRGHLIPAAVAMAFCAPPALADTAQPSQQQERQHVELAPVTVSGSQLPTSKVDASASAKYAAPLLDTPQTITVVPQHVLEEQNALSLRQALFNVSGITFNAGEGGGGSGDSINIRGFSANASMQVDGLRDSAQNNRSDLFNVEAVEVIKGPNSVFGGAGTTGGTINIVSKQPRADTFTHVDGGVGTARYRRLTLDTNQPLPWDNGKTVVRLNLMAHENEVPGRDVIERRRWGIAPSVTFGMGTPTRFTLNYFHQQDRNLPDYGVPALYGQRLPGISRQAYFGWRNVDREHIETDAATARLEHDFNDRLKIQNLTRYSRVHRDTVISASHVNQSGLPPGRYIPAGPQGYGRDATTEMWINQTNLTSLFDTLGLGHTLVSGFEISRETYGRDTYSYNLSRYYPANGFDLAAPPGYWAYPTRREDSARTRTWLDIKALYAMDTIALDKQWDLNLGLRYDWIDGSAENTPAGKAAERTASATRHLSTRAGVVFKPTDNGRVYFAYGTSFNPSAEYLVTTGTGVDKNTANLAPEKNRAFELGTKWELLTRRLAVNGALFQVDKTNARERLSDGSYLLAGEQRVRGLELGVSGKLTAAWDLYANYTYLNSQTVRSLTQPQRDGKALANTPPHSLSLWTAYQLPAGWALGYGARFVSRRNVTSAGDGTLGAYLMHSAMIGYAPNKQLRFQLNIDNLFNKAYVDRVRQSLGSASRSSALEYGDRRSAMLSAVYSF